MFVVKATGWGLLKLNLKMAKQSLPSETFDAVPKQSLPMVGELQFTQFFRFTVQDEESLEALTLE